MSKFSEIKLLLQNKSKIGGNPDWIQNDETPTCFCGKVMTFFSQIETEKTSIQLGDFACIYTFVCMDCLDIKSILQNY